MFNEPQPEIEVCKHERRPGTTVCLHCRHAARLAAVERRKRLVVRGSVIAVIAVVFGGAVALSATTLRGRANRKEATPVQVVASTEQTAPTSSQDSVGGNVVPTSQQGGGARLQAPLVPTIPMGETVLADSVIAYRVDTAVTLSFDRPMARTRLPDKFEHFLRVTLAQVYGTAIDSVLAKVPEGGMVSQGDLLYDLPTRGIQVPISDTWKLTVYPEIRPGQDGPLVIRYRAVIGPKA